MIGLSLALSLFTVHSAAPAGAEPPPAYRIEAPDRAWATRTLKKLTLREKVGQLVQIRAGGRFLNRESREYLQLLDEVRRNHVGGVVLFAGNVYESAILLNELQEQSDLPLIVSADFERGAAMRITDATSFPWAMAFGAAGSEDFAFQEGAITAREARPLGVHWIFAPVVDVNNNPDNPVINVRSFGEDPEMVARLGAAFIRGARDNGVLTTAKHFPGHGDTATDSHIGLAVIPSDQARLDAVEMVPFRRAIAAGVDSIMTAHVTMPKVTAEPETPATLSSRVLTGLLRKTLGFQGLIVTDALEMGGITAKYWTGLAAVRSLQAGADLLLLPPEADVAIDEVVRAVGRGDLTEERINTSVEKLLLAKTSMRLHKTRTVSTENLVDVIGTPESRKLAQDVADAAVTLVKDTGHLLPVNPVDPPKIFSVVLSSELDTAPGSVFQAELRERFPSARTLGVDPRVSDDLVATIMSSAQAADLVVCATLVRTVSGKGSIALPENHRDIVEKLFATGRPVVWIAFGNPYVLRLFPQAPTYLCTFSHSDVSQAAAAKALAGEIPIAGTMPVSIPGSSRVGDGLQIPRLAMTLAPGSLESLGLKSNAFDDTVRMLEGFVKDQAFPGALLMVGFRGSLALEAAVGHLDYDSGSAPVNADTMYDLASLTKVIGTTTAAMMLAESGRLLLDAAVQDYLPEFRGLGKEKVRVADLLTHSAGLPAWLPLYKEAAGYDEMLKTVFALPLEYAPGSKVQYSDFGMILMGEIIQRASARSLDKLLADRLFEPMGMQGTGYNPARSLMPRIAPTEDDPWRKRVVRGEVHDENAFAMGGISGHAGLFSTGRDLAAFAQMMVNRGVYDHRRYLKPETIVRFTAAQGPPGSAQGFGWRKPAEANWTGLVFPRSAYGHTGFTGTSLWIVPERQAFILLLSNRVHPSRQNQKIEEVRRVISETVMNVLNSAAPPGARR